MPKKPPPNPFYFFMKEMQEELRDRGQRVPNLRDMPVMANPLWKQLSADEKAPYELMAKDFKRNRTQTEDGKFTSDGIPIQHLRAQEKEMQDKLNAIETAVRSLITMLPTSNDISQTSFFVMGFNILIGTYDLIYLPNEIGIIEYSIEDGIKNEYHNFIDPGQIPIGYACEAKLFSETVHKIPISGFALATNDYGKVYQDVKRFLGLTNSTETRYVFCHPDQIDQYQKCLDWLKIAANCHTSEEIVFANLALLVFEMRQAIDENFPYMSTATEAITSSAFDYSPNTRCEFHEEEDNKYCALGYCKRLGFILSDNLCKAFGVDLTRKHFPERPPALEASTWQPKQPLRPVVNRINVPLKPIVPHIPTTIVTNVRSQFGVYDDQEECEIVMSDVSSVVSESLTFDDDDTYPSLSDKMSTLSVGSIDSVPSFRSLPTNTWAQVTKTKSQSMRRPFTTPGDLTPLNAVLDSSAYRYSPAIGRGIGLGRGRGLLNNK